MPCLRAVAGETLKRRAATLIETRPPLEGANGGEIEPRDVHELSAT